MYFGWDGYKDMIKEWEGTPDPVPTPDEVLFASYGCEEAYTGDAVVVFTHEGKLYEVNGSHCSCNGLEGQWAPEETSWGVLKMRNLSTYCHTQEAQEYFKKMCEEEGGK